MSETVVEPQSPEENMALAWCNERRAIQNLDILDGFIPGHPWECDECAITRTAHIYSVYPHPRGGIYCIIEDKDLPLPSWLNKFALDFDEGKYPHLVEEL